MPMYISAKEFRKKFSELAEDLKKVREIIVLKRSRPLFKIVPFEDTPQDLLEKASLDQDNTQPDLQEISKIVHELRGVQ